MKSRNHTRFPIHLATAAGIALGGTLSAASITWDGDTSTDWAAGANWAGGTAPTSNITTDAAVFNATTPNQPNLAASRSVSGINFTGNTGTLNWTLSGASGTSLTLGSGGIDSTGFRDGTVTISVPTIIMGSTAGTVWSVFDSTGSLSTNSVFTVNSDIQVNATAQLDLLSNRASSGTGTGTVNLNGIISGTTAGGVRFRATTGSRNTFILAGANTYTGTTTLQQTSLNFTVLANAGSASSFGQSGTVVLGDSASFAAASYTGTGIATTDRQWTINGAGGGTLNNNSNNTTGGALSFTNTSVITGGTAGSRILTLGGTFTAGTNTLAAQVSNMTGFSTAVTKNGASVWKLTNILNDFAGTLTAVGGELQMDAIPDGGVIAYNGGIVAFTGTSDDTSNRLLQIGTVGGNITAQLRSSGAGALDMTNTGAVTQVGGITAGSGLRLGGTNVGDNYFRASLGDLNGVAVKFDKADSGKWILTNTHTYTGVTTVSAGTLLVDGALGNTAVTVANAATIGGSGTIAGSLTFVGDSFLDVESAVFDSDPLGINGTVTFASGFGINNLKISDWDAVPLGSHTILSSSQNFSAAGLDNWGVGNAVSVGTPALGRSAYLENGSLRLVVIPEPAAVMLGGLGLIGLLRRRRLVG